MNVRLRSSALKLSTGTFARGFSFEDFRLIIADWVPSFGNFRFGPFALELSRWNLRLGTFA